MHNIIYIYIYIYIYQSIDYFKGKLKDELNDNQKIDKSMSMSKYDASSIISKHLVSSSKRIGYHKMKNHSNHILENALKELEKLSSNLEKVVSENKDKKNIETLVKHYFESELRNIFKSMENSKNSNIDESKKPTEEAIIYDDYNLKELNELLRILAINSKNGFIKFQEKNGTYYLSIQYYFNYTIKYKSSYEFLDYIKNQVGYLLSICFKCTERIRDILRKINFIDVDPNFKTNNNETYDKLYKLLKELIKSYLDENKEIGVNKKVLDEIINLEHNSSIGGKRSKYKKSPTKKAPTKKSPTKKSPTKKSPTKKAPAKKSPIINYI
jgi:hypothetical protein